MGLLVSGDKPNINGLSKTSNVCPFPLSYYPLTSLFELQNSTNNLKNNFFVTNAKICVVCCDEAKRLCSLQLHVLNEALLDVGGT